MKLTSIELFPGESLENNVNLDFYTVTNPSYTGIYKIRAKYNDLISNEININISEPTGFENRIYDFTTNEERWNRNSTYSKEFLDSIRENFLDTYPTSKYAPSLCEQFLINLSIGKDSTKFFAIFDNYMRYNKNRLATLNIISAYVAFLKSFLSYDNIILKLEQLKFKYQTDQTITESIDRFIKLNFYNDKYLSKN